MRLTETSIKRLALSPGKADEIFFDDDLPGFGLRVRAGGSRKFIVQYRMAGVQRRYTLGSAATLDLEDARKKAKKVLVAVDDGKDPAAEKVTQRAALALIFSQVMDDYLSARERTMRPRSLEESRRHLNKHWKPLHKLALASVSRPVIAAHLKKMGAESGPVAANRARSTLSALFAWAIGDGLCETNPVIGTNKASENEPRDRVLSDAELAAIWKAAPDTSYGRLVKLLMLTGQRRDEIGSLRWSEVILTGKAPHSLNSGVQPPMIALPGERTKNGQPHDIPLAPAAVAVIEAQPRITGRDFAFGDRGSGFGGWSKAKAALDDISGVAGWTLHDLRRTAATRMADLGVQPHVIEAILNHVSGHKAGVAGIYNRSTYAAEKRAALELWASHLQVIVAQAEGLNVHRLESRKRR